MHVDSYDVYKTDCYLPNTATITKYGYVNRDIWISREYN